MKTMRLMCLVLVVLALAGSVHAITYLEDFATDPGWTTSVGSQITWDSSTQSAKGTSAYDGGNEGEYYTSLPTLAGNLTDTKDWSFSLDFYAEDGYKARASYALRNSTDGSYIGYYGYDVGSGTIMDNAAMWKLTGWGSEQIVYEGTTRAAETWYTIDVVWDATTRKLRYDVTDRTTSTLLSSTESGVLGVEWTFSFDEFVCYEGYGNGAYAHTAYMDNLEINAVPEPATMALFGLGGLAMLRRRNRN